MRDATEAPDAERPAPDRGHCGDLGADMARWGGAREEWLDLSTGVNPVPYPLPPLAAADWTRLPQRDAEARLVAAARAAWGASGGTVVPAPGTQALIQRAPRLRRPGRVGIAGPTYAEHATAFAAEGWAVSGPALAVGAAAPADGAWAEAARARLAADAARLGALGAAAGWREVGRTALFVTFATPEAGAARERLAAARILSRAFPWSATWLRLGLPGDAAGWARLAAALA
jgi:histidinol-phosphate/aromatic aminotransferase/cobyric acid decarboxylase-like protein